MQAQVCLSGEFLQGHGFVNVLLDIVQAPDDGWRKSRRGKTRMILQGTKHRIDERSSFDCGHMLPGMQALEQGAEKLAQGAVTPGFEDRGAVFPDQGVGELQTAAALEMHEKEGTAAQGIIGMRLAAINQQDIIRVCLMMLVFIVKCKAALIHDDEQRCMSAGSLYVIFLRAEELPADQQGIVQPAEGFGRCKKIIL